MSIATKRGDDGTTSLLFGRRVSKNHPRVAAYGGVDELNSALGLCRAHARDEDVRTRILEIQKEMVYLMAELATDDADHELFEDAYAEKRIDAPAVDRLTADIETHEARAGNFKGWTYAGQTPADAFFDQARTTCRRAERGLITLRDTGAAVRPVLVHYLNRLADLLWLIGREHA